ncbi:MAG: hypothetical protein KME28_27515 [Pelatocladus maniniholoensis HA4357-MV3]|jgi:hypothetical protein|uniref:Actin-like protein N-terminal domain-containing protein n=1 Tax=Pelatocladus maniniholoensis HA4357-MV3 TaxID=1117104 RepID=A0A9E3HDX8_9NOST|nr:hypothetical protein [Pelatocladus maniniholoensis HA4357-MV3]
MSKQVFPFNVGFDCGNGLVKLKVSGHGHDFEYIRFPSYFVDVTKCHNDHQGKSRVTYITAPENNKYAKSLENKVWVCGNDAAVLDVRDQVFDNRSDGKVKLSLPLFLSAVAQLPLARKHWEFRLVASIHDAEVFADQMKANLEGKHLANINGQLTTVVIHVVKIFDEGYIFKPVGKGNTTLLDIGNGTTIITRFDSEGNVIYRSIPYKFGVQHLYKKIYDHTTLRAIGLDRDLDLIRRGVESPDNEKIFYGVGKGAINITSAYKESLKDWSTVYLKEPIAEVDKFQLQGDRVVVVGGGACLPFLSKNFEKKGYIFNAQAPFMNVKKLHEYACNSLSAETVEA